MFIGRERELHALEKLYQSNKFEFAVIYGRRTAQIKLLPFDFGETCRYFKNFSDEDKAYEMGNVILVEYANMIGRMDLRTYFGTV